MATQKIFGSHSVALENFQLLGLVDGNRNPLPLPEKVDAAIRVAALQEVGARLIQPDEGKGIRGRIRDRFAELHGFHDAIVREGHASDGLTIAAAATCWIPVVGLATSLASSMAAVGCGIASTVRGNQFNEEVQNLGAQFESMFAWSCVGQLHLGAKRMAEEYTEDKVGCGVATQPIWALAAHMRNAPCKTDANDLAVFGRRLVAGWVEAVRDATTWEALRAIRLDDVQVSAAGYNRTAVRTNIGLVYLNNVQLQLGMYLRVLTFKAISPHLISIAAKVGLDGNMTSFQKVADYIGKSTEGGTAGPGVGTAILCVIAAGLAIYSIVQREEAKKQMKSSLVATEAAYLDMYGGIIDLLEILRDMK